MVFKYVLLKDIIILSPESQHQNTFCMFFLYVFKFLQRKTFHLSFKINYFESWHGKDLEFSFARTEITEELSFAEAVLQTVFLGMYELPHRLTPKSVQNRYLSVDRSRCCKNHPAGRHKVLLPSVWYNFVSNR